jgi:phosphomevalonate kinase
MNPPHLIGISGKQFSGKDVLADALVVALEGYEKIPLALAIKQEYGRRHGLTLEEIEANKAEHRPGLIVLGDWGRGQDPDYWLKQVLRVPGRKIISDVRLRREFELLREHGAYLVRVEADRRVREGRGRLVSETDLTECDLDGVETWDCVLENNGTVEAFETAIQRLLQTNGWV